MRIQYVSDAIRMEYAANTYGSNTLAIAPLPAEAEASERDREISAGPRVNWPRPPAERNWESVIGRPGFGS